MTDKTVIRTHMKRFRVLASRRSNKHIIFLHVYCQMSLPMIAYTTGISRKTVTRLLMGQLPTIYQLRRLKRTTLAATIELEKLTDYAAATREGVYYSQIIHHTVHLGRQLSAGVTAEAAASSGKTRK